MSALVEDKARALLVSGAVQVLAVGGLVRARVAGHHGTYEVTWAPVPGWRCSCPERRGRCSHIRAVARVTIDGEAIEP